ncbi:MAG: TRCF domain-containing protein [Halanaerobiales bacterium]
MIDRFGDPPEVVNNLFEITRISLEAKKLGIKKIDQKDEIINLNFGDMDNIDGKSVMELINKYPRKIKVKSGNNPVIGIKIDKNKSLQRLKNVLKDLSNLTPVNVG